MEEVDISKAYDVFRPEACVFVISVDSDGKPNGMIAAWNMKCSKNPPLIAVAVSNKSNTNQLIRSSKEFVIAVANNGIKKELKFFGSVHGNDVDKFKETELKTERSKHIKSPLIRDATVNFECELFNSADAGDHTIFIGKILASYGNSGKGVLMQTGSEGKRKFFEEFKKS